MKLYLAIIEDRHTDVEIEVFTSADAAIAYAKEQMHENVRHPEDIKEMIIQDRLYYATYSVEGDCVYVVEKELHSE